MTVQRIDYRKRQLKEGRVIFNGKTSVFSCVVRDISEHGARLKLGEPYRVPDIFELVIGNAPPRPARKVWIGPGELGAAFT
jgi:PilZ domain